MQNQDSHFLKLWRVIITLSGLKAKPGFTGFMYFSTTVRMFPFCLNIPTEGQTPTENWQFQKQYGVGKIVP